MTRIEKNQQGDITLSHKDYGQARYGKQFGEWYIHLGSERVGFCAQFSMRNTKIAVI